MQLSALKDLFDNWLQCWTGKMEPSEKWCLKLLFGKAQQSRPSGFMWIGMVTSIISPFTTSLTPQLKLYVCYKMLFERCCHIPGMMMYGSSNTIGIVSVWSRGEISGANPEVKPVEDLFCSRACLLSGRSLCCSTTESLLTAKFYINSWLESSLAQASTLFPSARDTH